MITLHVVRKPTEPGKPQKWRITCDYRELNKVIRNHAYPLPDVTETIRVVREQGKRRNAVPGDRARSVADDSGRGCESISAGRLFDKGLEI